MVLANFLFVARMFRSRIGDKRDYRRLSATVGYDRRQSTTIGDSGDVWEDLEYCPLVELLTGENCFTNNKITSYSAAEKLTKILHYSVLSSHTSSIEDT